VLLTSSYEFPGRCARWMLGFSDPPLELSGTGRDFRVRALKIFAQVERVVFLGIPSRRGWMGGGGAVEASAGEKVLSSWDWSGGWLG